MSARVYYIARRLPSVRLAKSKLKREGGKERKKGREKIEIDGVPLIEAIRESKPFFNIGRAGTHCVYITQNAADIYRNVNELERVVNPINRFSLVTDQIVF